MPLSPLETVFHSRALVATTFGRAQVGWFVDHHLTYASACFRIFRNHTENVRRFKMQFKPQMKRDT